MQQKSHFDEPQACEALGEERVVSKENSLKQYRELLIQGSKQVTIGFTFYH